MSRARLLRFPAPYRAALAISNDTDDLLDPRGWWEFMRFLNTVETTSIGPGLGLEVGDSFWFWSDDPDEQPGSYFKGLSEEPSAFAPLVGILGRAGYLDTVHSYGHFSRHGGFRREHALRAADVLEGEAFSPRVWVNHGGAHDFQNLGSGCGDLPENPEARGAPAPEFHLDVTRKIGFRYAWVGDLTGTPGQSRPLGTRDWLHPDSPVRREAAGYLARGLSRRLGYRHILETFPNYGMLANDLLTPRRMRDGTVMQTFVRYGDFDRATFADLDWLLREYMLDTLEGSGGLSIVFVHWSRHPGRSFRDLPPSGLQGLTRLADRFKRRRIWVTTTARLLAYWEARSALEVRHSPEASGAVLHVVPRKLPDGRALTVHDLSGISFEVPDPAHTRVLLNGITLPFERSTHHPNVLWLPWKPLVFPDPPAGMRA
jgi:hypothetical protein